MIEFLWNLLKDLHASDANIRENARQIVIYLI